ncbi:hypothetical protein RHMOL_Rhmol03G0129300 [Rhododendron molle]|uniref:Uncharacterized protein n=1 Tax=Rhododendron molle TaxID=49168 RepID=A0ACC0PG58_RHOML|nr:hypothetical protein RHMOL_Rhmol03G0129300 [Rhododendron molle]
MSTSGNEPHEHEREHEHESSDDDLMDLEMLSMSSEDEVNRIPQRTFLAKGQTYTQFLMTEHPTTIKDLLRVDKRTFKSLFYCYYYFSCCYLYIEVVASTDAAASAVLCTVVTAAACSRNCYKCY